MTRPLTPSQTIGPFFGHALPFQDGPRAVDHRAPGAVWLRGRITDGAGDPVTDALVETWQAGPDGNFDHPDDARGGSGGTGGGGFRGFARCPTDADGCYAILTVKPGRVPMPDGELQAPHLDMSIFARGLLQRLVTRVYFADEPQANATDPVLRNIQDEADRATLLAQPSGDGYVFDIRLQDERETVFFIV
ncbi:MAG: protocatechuate 3,4-dioxygenase subunit alpha [Actinomycetota bacterium]|nr:protocatechuate 3,4-dioxygenase subunit alpha [Actinomycetota bacterium]